MEISNPIELNASFNVALGQMAGNGNLGLLAGAPLPPIPASSEYYKGCEGQLHVLGHGIDLVTNPDNFDHSTAVDGSLLQFFYTGSIGTGGFTQLHTPPSNIGLPLTKFDNTTPLDQGDIIPGANYLLIFRTTYFELINPSTLQEIVAPAGVVIGAATGGVQGADTLNAAGLFVNGVAVGGGSSAPDFTTPPTPFNTVIANQVTLIPHLLGVQPNRAQMRAINTVADLGWSPGEMVMIGQEAQNSVGLDATNVILMSNGVTDKIPDKTNGSPTTITPGSWTLVADVWKV